MAAAFFLRMFGALKLETGSETYAKFPTKRSALVLARLAVSKNHTVGRDELAEQLWPDDFLDLTRLRLRQELRRLRQSIGALDQHILTDRQWVEIEQGCLTTDVEMFDLALADSQNAEDAEARVLCLRRAVDLLDGPFLAGFQEPWVLAMRRDFEEKARRAWLALADSLQSLNEPEEALRANMNAVRHAPLDIEANASLIRRYVDSGRIAQARQAFYEFDGMMFRELGRHAPNSIRASIDAMAPEDEPVAAAIEPIRASLPRPLPLHGRAGLLETIQSALSRHGASVVLVGAVGVGKTHLLKEAAWQFSRANDIPIQFGGIPAPVADGLYLPDPSSHRTELLTLMLSAALAGWRVLAESRIRLESEGITEIVVNPLPIPLPSDEPAEIRANPSVQVLLSKLSEQMTSTPSDKDVKDLAELARRLDGMPAALKVFSSRLMIQTPDQVLKSVEDGLLEYSQDLIAPNETVGLAVLLLAAGLSNDSRELFIALSLLDGVSVDLSEKLAAPMNPTEIWLSLERQCLITVSDDGPRRRYRVPHPLAYAVRNMADAADRSIIAARTWRAISEWTFEKSRMMVGPYQEYAFNAVEAEIANILRALDWAIESDHATAGQLVCGIWRTLCARGNTSANADILLRGAQVGVQHLELLMAGEAWIGAATALSICGRIEEAEIAYLASLKAYEERGDTNRHSWVTINYAESVISRIDMRKAIEMSKEAADRTTDSDVKAMGLFFYAMGLADMGESTEAVRVAEEVFASRLGSPDLTEQARGYGDLAHMYRKVGRREAAEPLLREGARRLRETGIQDMLLETLLILSETSLDLNEVRDVLAEASAIASRLGSNAKLLEVARARMGWASQQAHGTELIAAIEDAFRFTQLSQSATELDRSLRSLAAGLDRVGLAEYSNAILASLGEPVEGPVHSGWKALLSSDSHGTVCVLAVVMAKEALGRRQP